MKAFFTFLFFCTAFIVHAQTFVNPDSIFHGKISELNEYVFVGGGVMYAHNEELSTYMNTHNGNKISNQMPDVFEFGLIQMSNNKNENNCCWGGGMKLDCCPHRFILEMSIDYGLPPGKRTSEFTSLNFGYDYYNFHADPPANIHNIYDDYYRLNNFLIGGSFHLNYFLHRNPQKWPAYFLGLETGINFRLLHSKWKYGYTEGSGKYAHFVDLDKKTDPPFPEAITIFIRMNFGLATP